MLPKQTLIVDEPAAEVVRKIFRLVCQGNSTTAIAEMLTAEKVLIPSAYAALNQPKNCRHKNVADPYRWSATTVGYILDRQEYLGHTVLGKSICENFKTKQRRAATPDELMIFPDTHEAIIDQDTWDIARKIRSKKKPRVANGTYSHRLSGLVYCADCGSRMGYISPEANHSKTHYDSDSAFQCGNYRSKSGECVSHYVKTSVLEAAILQAIQTVSKYVLENEDEFIQQLKAVWNEQQTRTANNGYQELADAKKRMAELDEKINKLYESTLSGLLPERQAQRMIQQYDEEQILLERRVAELENLVQQDEIKQVDASRFIALVRKYRDCEELTDTMLYAFIDRIEVHEATGGRTIYRQQNIDIHFNFIGNYYPPVETVSEEERIAVIEAEQLTAMPGRPFALPRCQCSCQQKELERELQEKERVQKELRISHRRELGLPSQSLQHYTFSQDNGRNPLMRKASAYVKHWEKAYQTHTGLLLFGNVGTGKSFFAGCIANALLDKDIPVLMTNFPTLLNRLTGLSGEERSALIAELDDYALLILDDLGVERNTEFVLEQMFQIIDGRYRCCKPLIVTTNLRLEEIKHPIDLAHVRIYGRILERCAPVLFDGRNQLDERTEQAKENARKIVFWTKD